MRHGNSGKRSGDAADHAIGSVDRLATILARKDERRALALIRNGRMR